MLTLFLNLIENLVKLAERRERLTEHSFSRYVEPTYKDAEAVYRNFAQILDTLHRKLRRARKSRPIVDYLIHERLPLLPVRDRLRELMRQLWSHREQFNQFEIGIIEIIFGSEASFDNMGVYHHITTPYGIHHALSYILHEIAHEPEISDRRGDLLARVTALRAGLDASWQRVVSGFVAWQLHVAGKGASPQAASSVSHPPQKNANPLPLPTTRNA